MVIEGHLGPLSKAKSCQLSGDMFKFYMGPKTREVRTKNEKMGLCCSRVVAILLFFYVATSEWREVNSLLYYTVRHVIIGVQV